MCSFKERKNFKENHFILKYNYKFNYTYLMHLFINLFNPLILYFQVNKDRGLKNIL